MAEGININEEDVQRQNVPDDLNSLAVGSYVIPDPIRRRRFGHLVSALSFINLFLDLDETVTSKNFKEFKCKEIIFPNIPLAPRTKTFFSLIYFRGIIYPWVPILRIKPVIIVF